MKSIGALPWGSQFCVFYEAPGELLEFVVPFLRAGLEQNERCAWELRAPLTIPAARRALASAIPGFAKYEARGQIDITRATGRAAARPHRKEVAVERRLDQAILDGFDGLRLVSQATDAAKAEEATLDVEAIGRLNVLSAVLYSRANVDAAGLMKRVQDHHFALVRNAGRWELLQGSEMRAAHDALRRTEEKLQSLFSNMSEGFAYCRIVLDAEGQCCDFVLLEVNAAFERLTGLPAKQVVGRRASLVLPGVERDSADWMGKLGGVALTGRPTQFESRSMLLDQWFAISAFSPHKGYFAITFADISDRRRAEADRCAAEERLEVTLRSIGDAVIATDTAGQVLILNRVAEELTGFTEREAFGRPLAEVFPIVNELTGEPAEDPVRKVIQSGTIVGLANHTALVRRDGRTLSIADSAAPVRSEHGDLLGVVLVFRDVTSARAAELAAEREKTELALANRILEVFLKESCREVLFGKALQVMLEGTGSGRGVFGYLGEDGQLVCPALLDEPAEASGAAGAGAPQVREPWQRALREKRTVLSANGAAAGAPERGGPRADELVVPILFQDVAIGLLCLADKAGGFAEGDRALVEAIARRVAPVLYAWVQRQLRDEEHAAAEQAVRSSEARFKLLSNSASLLLVTHDPEGAVNAVCHEVMQHLDCQVFLSYLAVDSPGTGTRRLHLNGFAGIPGAEARRLEWLDENVATRFGDEAGKPAAAVDGAPPPAREAEAYCCHPLIAEGGLLGTLCFGTRTRTHFSEEDVALMRTVADQVAVALERARAHEALQAANARLVESDQRKNEFLATLSHELRNPLAPIKNSLYVLRRAPPESPPAKRALEVIDRQASQLSNLVNDLLDVTRISKNKIHLQRERLALNEVVRRVVEDHRTLFDRAGVRLESTPAPATIHVDADATRLAQIVGNLLQNAAKFSRWGGCTRVSVATEGGEATVAVTDDGVGMSAQTRERLFQPFMQAEQSLDRSKGGLGLGLALVKGLVELHGGSISARSDGLGRGAEFTIRLPVADTGKPVAQGKAPKAGGARRRVLIIEDNFDAAESLREALVLADHTVEVAYNGAEGLKKAATFCPDFVLCDIGLPGMDGYQVARAFRADRALGGAALVAISGYALPEDKQRAAEAGFDQHLAKPISLDKLLEVLA